MLRARARRASSRPRRHKLVARVGVTLVELLVALVLAALVSSAVVRSRAQSQGAATDALATADARRQLRAGTGAVLATLRGAAPAGGDLLALADSALELRATLGASVACDALPAAIDRPPSVTLLAPPVNDGVARPPTLATDASGWHDAPAPGDVMLALVHDDPARVADPRWRWRSAMVVDASAALAPCLGAVAAPTVRVALATSLADAVSAGTPVRLLRRGRWSVYRSGSRWYLGWHDVTASGAGLDVVQPVSGPHDVRDARGSWRAALAFRGTDADGRDVAEVLDTRVASDVASLARVATLTLRAQSPVARRAGAPAAESLSTVVALRNRAP